MNTRITLMYRDSCNYKAYSRVVFAGEPTLELGDRLVNALADGEFIVTEQVGLTHPALLSDMNNGRFPDEEDDHGYTEVGNDSVESTTEEPTDPRTFEQFVIECERVSREGWDPDVAIAAAGGWSDRELAARLRGGDEDEEVTG